MIKTRVSFFLTKQALRFLVFYFSRNIVRSGGIIMNLARVSTNGQITVPAEIRRALNVREGDKILFYQKPNGEIVINNTSHISIQEADRLYSSEYAQIPGDDNVPSG
jgi:AbrB family looped-hinge helix DNA binding protein